MFGALFLKLISEKQGEKAKKHQLNSSNIIHYLLQGKMENAIAEIVQKSRIINYPLILM